MPKAHQKQKGTSKLPNSWRRRAFSYEQEVPVAHNRSNLFGAPDLRGFGGFVRSLARRVGGLRLIEFSSRATRKLTELLHGPIKQESYQILGPFYPRPFRSGTPKKRRRGKDRAASPQGSPFEYVTLHMLRRSVNKGFVQQS